MIIAKTRKNEPKEIIFKGEKYTKRATIHTKGDDLIVKMTSLKKKK